MNLEMKLDAAGMPEFLRFDEREDTISALEHAVDVASTLNAKPLNWKWLLIAIHNALQGALVCTLSGSDGTGALSESSMKKVWDWYEASFEDSKTQHPTEWLAPPLELFKRVKKQKYMQEYGGAAVVTTPQEDKDIPKLNVLRRGFAHYTPRYWCIETAGLPRIVLNAVGVVEKLLRHPAFSLRITQEQRDRAHGAIHQLRRSLPRGAEEKSL